MKQPPRGVCDEGDKSAYIHQMSAIENVTSAAWLNLIKVLYCDIKRHLSYVMSTLQQGTFIAIPSLQT